MQKGYFFDAYGPIHNEYVCVKILNIKNGVGGSEYNIEKELTTVARLSPAGPKKSKEHLKSCCKHATAAARECEKLNLKGHDALGQRKYEAWDRGSKGG
jgi:hypothetical protein